MLSKGVVTDFDFAKYVLFSPFYSLKECLWFTKDISSFQNKILTEIANIDISEMKFQNNMPIIFISGNKDWVTPYTLVKEFYTNLEVESKQMIIIDNAGHSPMIDKPKIFAEELITALSKVSLK